MNVKVTKLGSL